MRKACIGTFDEERRAGSARVQDVERRIQAGRDSKGSHGTSGVYVWEKLHEDMTQLTQFSAQERDQAS